MTECKKCNREYDPKFIHRHHILPYSIFETYDCPTIILCRWCHKNLHNDLEILGYTIKENIKRFTEEWLKGNSFKKEREDIFPLCSQCKTEKDRLFLFEVCWNYLILHCPICGYHSSPDKKSFILWQRKIRREESIKYKQLNWGYKDLGEENDSLF